jgi:hypothetical protein
LIIGDSDSSSKDLNYGSSSLATRSMAIVRPTFTSAAYDNAFYNFYKLNSNINFETNVTRDLDLLSNTITNKTTRSALLGSSTFATSYLLNHIKELSPISNITVLTDAGVHNGRIFKRDGNNAYVATILGHQEYVTQKRVR